MTLGELIESGYRTCGKRRARGIIRLATKARLIVFEGNAARLRFPTRASFLARESWATEHAALEPRLALATLVPPFGEADPATEAAWSQGPLQPLNGLG